MKSHLLTIVAMTTIGLASCASKSAEQAAEQTTTQTSLQEGEDLFVTTNGTPILTHCIKHGTLSICVGEKWIYVDPVTEQVPPVTDYTTMPKADLVLVTHAHPDHLDTKAIERLTHEGTTIMANPESAERIEGQVEVMKNGDSRSWNACMIEAVPAYNTSVDKQNFHPQGRDNGYILTVDGLRIYIAGDTEPIPEMADIHDIDIAFLPCNLPYTMTPEQLAEVAKTIRPKVLFPYHYGETDIQQVVTLLDSTDIDVRIRQYQ